MTKTSPLRMEWVAQIRQEIHEMAREIVDEASVRGGVHLRNVPRPIEAIAEILGTHVQQVSGEWLKGNKGLCTETAIVVHDHDGRDWVRRFTIAHELGHQFLGVEAQERECDAFAGSLLIPARDVRQELARRHLDNPSTSLESWARYEQRSGIMTQLARRYNVGYGTMIRALADYGFVHGVAPWTAMMCGEWVYKQYESFYQAFKTEI